MASTKDIFLSGTLSCKAEGHKLVITDEVFDDAIGQYQNTINSWISSLRGESGDKSVKEIVAEEIAKIVNGAPAAFDTLKEIADWITTHGNTAATMNSDIIEIKKLLEGFSSTSSTEILRNVKTYIDSKATEAASSALTAHQKAYLDKQLSDACKISITANKSIIPSNVSTDLSYTVKIEDGTNAVSYSISSSTLNGEAVTLAGSNGSLSLSTTKSFTSDAVLAIAASIRGKVVSKSLTIPVYPTTYCGFAAESISSASDLEGKLISSLSGSKFTVKNTSSSNEYCYLLINSKVNMPSVIQSHTNYGEADIWTFSKLSKTITYNGITYDVYKSNVLQQGGGIADYIITFK